MAHYKEPRFEQPLAALGPFGKEFWRLFSPFLAIFGTLAHFTHPSRRFLALFRVLTRKRAKFTP